MVGQTSRGSRIPRPTLYLFYSATQLTGNNWSTGEQTHHCGSVQAGQKQGQKLALLFVSEAWTRPLHFISLTSDHGIFQARILEWVVISCSRERFLTQGLNLCLLRLLHWQAHPLLLHMLDVPDFSGLYPQTSPDTGPGCYGLIILSLILVAVAVIVLNRKTVFCFVLLISFNCWLF